MQKITPFLTFKDRGAEAIEFYVSLFSDGKVITKMQNDTEGSMPKGALLHAMFEMNGQQFMAMDGGEYFSFSQGFSIFVGCETQEEVDILWSKLAEGGEEQPCGWVKDRFGVSWQIVPNLLGQLMQDPDRTKANRVMQAMLTMKKIDSAELQRAYDEQ